MIPQTSDIARCYTKAIFELAEEKKVPEMVLLELQSVLEAFSKQEGLFRLFRSPVISKTEKRSIAEKIFANGSDSLAKWLLFVLVERNRTDLLSAIVKQFEQALNEKKGFVEAVVVTAHKLSEEVLGKIREGLEWKLSKKVICKSSEDPELMGGVRVRIGNRLIDGSVRTKLNELRVQLGSIK